MIKELRRTPKPKKKEDKKVDDFNLDDLKNFDPSKMNFDDA